MANITLNIDEVNLVVSAINDQMERLDIQADEYAKMGEPTESIREEISALRDARNSIVRQSAEKAA